MHGTQERMMVEFITQYLDPDKETSILDLGSYDVNGCYRPLFTSPKWRYVGADIAAGPNVDIVMKDCYDWGIEGQFDVVISGSTMEHIEDLKEWISQIPKILKPGGLVLMEAPFYHGIHRHPKDCWRVVEDGMAWLLGTVCGFEILKISTENEDTVGIARRKDGSN